MHVLVVPSWYPTPIAPVRGIFFREQARALRRAGLKIGVAYPELRRLRTLPQGELLGSCWQVTVQVEDGLPTVRRRGWNPPGAKLRRRVFVRQVQGLVKRYMDEFGRPDLVHAHAARWAGVAAAQVRRELRIPYVVTEHSTAVAGGDLDPLDRQGLREAYRDAASVLSVSHALADSLVEFVDPDKVHVVPNVVDTEFFSLPPSPRSHEPFTFVTVAALRRKKGLDVLLEAFRAAFGSRKADVRLRIAGDGPQAEELEDLRHSLGLEGRVELLGRLSREGVRRELWRANVGVLPSRLETFGVAVIEAMATGLPVVATSSGGPEEIVTTETGWVVPPDDSRALASALEAAFDAGIQGRFPEQAIRRYAVDRYGEEAVTSRLVEIYDSVHTGTPPG